MKTKFAFLLAASLFDRTNFVATHSSRTKAVYNLKKVSCFNAYDSWNDRISSISFHVGYADNLPEEY